MLLLHTSSGRERDVGFHLVVLTELRGAEIAEAPNEVYPSGVNQSRIYQILLKRQGLVCSRHANGRSKVYEVTDGARGAAGILQVDDSEESAISDRFSFLSVKCA